MRVTTAWCAAGIVIGAVAWLVVLVLARLWLITVPVVVAILLTALFNPGVSWLRRKGVPGWTAALAGLLLLLALPAALGLLVWSRLSRQFSGLRSALTEGVDRLKELLVAEPLALRPEQVDRLRDVVMQRLGDALPSPLAGATAAVELLAAAALAAFVLFFLLKDGPQIWQWLVHLAPAAHRDRVIGVGDEAWTALSSYVTGAVLVATVDATGIGLALFILGVPLALSLTVLVFLGAFLPLVGATISGTIAVVVTLVSVGTTQAVIVLVVVLAVQAMEGNLLQPFIMGRALRLHPLVIILAVSAGALLAGVAGAVIAVPLVAVAYRVASYLRTATPAAGPDAHGGE